MKCPNCGRENPDIRLFCMQCGELLPETEESEQQSYAAPSEFSRPAETAEDIFVPETVEDHAAEDISAPETAAEYAPEEVPQDIAPEIPDELDDVAFYRSRQRARGIVEEAWPEEPVQQPKQPVSLFDGEYETPAAQENIYSRPAVEDAPRRPELNRRAPESGRAKTHIPRREENLDPDDFFAVRGQVLPEYDEEDAPAPKRKRGREEAYEEAPQSFAVRHMRGIVTLMLLVLTVTIVLIWANTDAAQYTLAKVDIAWKSDAYAQLADEAYAANDLSAAGYYYTAALKRDESNYNYAVMAANSYIEGGYTAKALDALRTCIGLQPANADLYAALIQLQPDTAEISASDRALIEKGYELTGDSRLNID